MAQTPVNKTYSLSEDTIELVELMSKGRGTTKSGMVTMSVLNQAILLNKELKSDKIQVVIDRIEEGLYV